MEPPLTPIVILGGGEHAQVIAEAILGRRDLWKLVGFTDPSPEGHALARMNISYLGSDEAWMTLPRRPSLTVILGLGSLLDPEKRTVIARRFRDAELLFATVVHARACVSPTARLKEGVFVAAGAIINAQATIGAHAIINTGAVVEHDVEVGDFAHVAPRAAIGGGARIGYQTRVGLGASIRDHVVIGSRVTVGMGAVVVNDVPDGQTVMGIPARRKRIA
jgi:acetyltransferase EpsM